MCEALKSNTTLTGLNLKCEDKRKKAHKRHSSANHSFLFSSAGNDIGDTGMSSLSDSLKSNTTLTELNMSGEDKRKKTHKRHPSTHQSFPFLFETIGNIIGDFGAKSLCESLKLNTTLTKLCLCGEDKRRRTKDIHRQFTLSFLINRKRYSGFRKNRVGKSTEDKHNTYDIRSVM